MTAEIPIPKPPVPRQVRRIGLFYARGIEEALQLALELEAWLRRLGIETWRGRVDETETIASCDLLFTLGGDGTALRGARLAAPLGIPLVCVGLGRLSFMAELVPEDVLKQLPSFLAGDYWLEERALLEGVVLRDEQPLGHCLALNEVVLGRDRGATTLQVAARVNGAYLTTYVADAVIVATATGSTAYALSAGGPILSPGSRDLLLLPVASHLCLLPPLVLAEDLPVELVVVRGFSAGVNCDGRPLCDLRTGDVVRVVRSQTVCYFARLQGRDYFYRTLSKRLYRQDEPFV
ncbi:MAG: NAD(+)/NADH kinase [Chloroflexia bacterium]|nr:NAD(+)/NADH kinase [Chloroflexia bacterium]